MSGGSSTNNSWTLLTPEETVAETLKPLAEGTEHHEGSHTSAAEGAVPSEGLPAADHLVSEDKTTEPSLEDVHKVAATSIPVPTSLEVMSSFVPESGSQSDDLPKATAQTSTDPDSFSDSYTHISPCPDERPASPLSTETLGGLESIQEEERLTQEGMQHPKDGEELQQEGDESELSQVSTNLGKETDSLVDSEVGEERLEKKGEEAQEEVRRRRPLLTALERIGRTEEEEDEDEEFQVPQREEDSGLSLNKCILGAVILLGLGTIFFSGVFMDLDEESDYGARELKDSEAPRKQEWLNPDVPQPTADADSTELLNKLAEGNQHITELQAQLQAQKEELKVAKGQAAEGAKERLQWEEVEKENSRLKKMMTSLPVLQKENERMKRELESVPALQKELERLTSTVTELKHSSAPEVPVKAATSPSSDQTEHSRHSTVDSTEKQARKPWKEQKEGKKEDWKKDKYDTGEKKEWREGDKSEWKGETQTRKDGGKAEGKEKEWKKGKPEQGRFEKEKEGKHKKHSEEPKQWKGKEKEWKKDKANRGDEGKPWKDREGKNERMERSEKDWKKSNYDKLTEGKEWKDKEQKKEWKSGKDHGEKQKSKNEWRGEKEWKKAQDGFKDSDKEKYVKKDQKEKGEKKEWKKDGDWKTKNDKDNSKDWKGQGERKHGSKKHDKEWKEKDERRHWSSESKSGKDEKEWKRKDERNQRGNDKRLGEEVWKEKKHNAEWKKDKSSFRKHTEFKNGGDHNHQDHSEEHVWGDRKPPHSHPQPSPDQPEFWVHKRDRLLQSTRPQQTCTSTTACAQADGVRLVHFSEFQKILQTYLSKAEEAGVDPSTTGELRKLAAEFFKDGLFVHDQMSFQDYVEDLGDILEDMVEEDESDDEEDSAIEDEMEGFELEVMQKFSVPVAGEEEKIKGDWRKESVRGRG